MIGFLLGGHAVTLGIATFPVLPVLDIVLPRDIAPRVFASPLLADLALSR